ncbi:response regulator transcription factor [Iamia sp. SCSIO 61187]|nr:response regulator transcription factor [Iamia sp. SCSIO 61187]
MDDYDVIVQGVASILSAHPDLVQVVDASSEGGPHQRVDVALLDCFALPDHGAEMIKLAAVHPNVGRVAVYTWATDPELVDAALGFGASGYLSKGLTGRQLAEALVAVHEGEKVVLTGDHGPRSHRARAVGGATRQWPGQEVGLTERESEVLALITQGKRTADIAAALYLSVNSIKTHTRNVFRKIGVSTRTEAALWGVDHGFRPDRSSAGAWSADTDG